MYELRYININTKGIVITCVPTEQTVSLSGWMKVLCEAKMDILEKLLKIAVSSRTSAIKA